MKLDQDKIAPQIREIILTVRQTQAVDPVSPNGPWNKTGDVYIATGTVDPAAAQVSGWSSFVDAGSGFPTFGPQGVPVPFTAPNNWALAFSGLPAAKSVTLSINAYFNSDFSGLAAINTKTA